MFEAEALLLLDRRLAGAMLCRRRAAAGAVESVYCRQAGRLSAGGRCVRACVRAWTARAGVWCWQMRARNDVWRGSRAPIVGLAACRA